MLSDTHQSLEACTVIHSVVALPSLANGIILKAADEELAIGLYFAVSHDTSSMSQSEDVSQCLCNGNTKSPFWKASGYARGRANAISE
jgi:hypothetical protein